MTGMRWSQEDLDRVLKRQGALHGLPMTKAACRNVEPVRQRMNKTEAEYAQLLEFRRLAGEIKAWGFERLKFRLADGAWFKPDFDVVGVGGEIEIHETKGFWREAARVRIKVAAEIYPHFTFRAVSKVQKRKGGGWAVEEF
jgi:hypothetical protein